MEEPNIFKFATKELSQDAFLCYLLSFKKEEYKKTEEYKIAKDFLDLCGIAEDVIDIKHQYRNIDVLVETENNYLIIEDKTDSFEHDNQIYRYIEEMAKEDRKKKITAVYFKTGFVSRKEKGWIEESFAQIVDETKNSLEKINLVSINLDLDNDKDGKLVFVSNQEKKDIFTKEVLKKNQIINQWYMRRTAELEEIRSAEEEAENFWKKNSPKLPEIFKNKRAVFLDVWSRHINKDKFKDVSWFISSGRTLHIPLIEYKRKLEEDVCRYAFYLVFNNSKYELTLKQHLDDINGNRYLTGKYPEKGKSFLKLQREVVKKIVDEEKYRNWKYINSRKDKENLMVIKKEFFYNQNMYDVLEEEYEFMQYLFKTLEQNEELNKKGTMF